MKRALRGLGLGIACLILTVASTFTDQALNEWLNPAAFEPPAPGTLGNFRRNSLRGPGFWAIDAAVSRLMSLGGSRRVELRVEAFNLLNTFNRNLPGGNFGAPSTFGRITSMAGATHPAVRHQIYVLGSRRSLISPVTSHT